MARVRDALPNPKLEALAAIRSARRLLDEPITSFTSKMLDAYLTHIGVQVEMIEAVKRPRKAKPETKPGRPAAVAVAP
jgi:hypothetical protein